MKWISLALLLLAFFGFLLVSSKYDMGKEYEELLYKRVDKTDLHLNYYSGDEVDLSLPVLMFIHGGGWRNGSPLEFHKYCQFFLKKGYRCISVEYRLTRNGISPMDSLEDCIDAYLWTLNKLVSPNRKEGIILVGGSAGGHLAYWVSRRYTGGPDSPKGLILFNPVLDTSESGTGYELFGERAVEFSLIHNPSGIMPPCLLVHSERDHITPSADVKSFILNAEGSGNKIDLEVIPGAEHGEYYWGRLRKPASLLLMDEWLER